MGIKKRLNAGITSVIIVSAMLGACGDRDDKATSRFSLGLTDAPVVGVSSVNITINEVELKSNSETFVFSVDETIDLMALQGTNVAPLVAGVDLPAGDYQWIRLSVTDANLMLEGSGGELPLDIPSSAQSGLKLNRPIVLPANGSADFILDFDVAKSLTVTGNQEYKLRPTIRLLNQIEVGHISGVVPSELLAGCNTGEASVYAFAGTGATFSDITGTADTDPQVTALVDASDNSFTLGFLLAGDYSLHLTCGQDNPEESDSSLASLGLDDVEVEENKTATAELEAVP